MRTLNSFLDVSGWKDMIPTWTVNRDKYIQQSDGSSCGPIVVLAFFYAYTGRHMFSYLIRGNRFRHQMRLDLVSWYAGKFKELEANGKLRLETQTNIQENFQTFGESRGLPGMILGQSTTSPSKRKGSGTAALKAADIAAQEEKVRQLAAALHAAENELAEKLRS